MSAVLEHGTARKGVGLRQVGRYRIVERVGHGAAGTVYRAEDTLIERIVALKTVERPGEVATPAQHDAFARFFREAKAAGALTHPNVCTIFDVGEDTQAGVSFIAMEFVEGVPLDSVLKARRRLPFETIRSIGAQVASALVAAHAAGIVHRDIKPGNLLLMADDTIKVADFGIAKVADAQMTQDCSFLGSPSYMSPEQVKTVEVDHRSDLFSLGTVLYELCTLRPAFPGKTVFDVIQRVATVELPSPLSICPDLPEDLAKVIQRAMVKNRDNRIQSAAEMELALRSPVVEIFSAPSGAALDELTTEEVDGETETANIPEPVTAKRNAARWLAGGALAFTLAGFAGLGGAWAHADPGTITGPNFPNQSGFAIATPDQDVVDEAEFLPTPRSRPARVRAPVRVAALPVPVAEPEAVATGVEAELSVAVSPFPFVFHVEHRHGIGSCAGTLQIHQQTITYDAIGRDQDDREFAYAAIRSFRFENGQLSLVSAEREKKRLGLGNKRYNYRIEGDLIPEAALAHLRAKIASP